MLTHLREFNHASWQHGMTSLVRASITFYVEYRQSDICSFRAMTLLLLQWVWSLPVFSIIAISFSNEKRGSTRWWTKFENVFTLFDTIHERVRRRNKHRFIRRWIPQKQYKMDRCIVTRDH